MDTKQKRNLSRVILTILTLSALVGIINFSPANALNYEWLQNPGFEDEGGLEMCSGGNFESGIVSGLTLTGAAAFSTAWAAHSPTTYVVINGAGSIQYNWTTPIPVGSIASIGMWVNCSLGSYTSTFHCSYYYSDGSWDTGANFDFNSSIDGYWFYFDIVGYWGRPDEGKSLKCLMIVWNDGSVCYDDVSLITYSQGQTTITTQTTPWYDNDYSVDTYQLINQTFGHSGSCSYQNSYGTIAAPNGIMATVFQNVPMVPTANVSSFSMWAYSDSISAWQITAFFIYSDGSTGAKSLMFNSYNQWSLQNFTSGLAANKYLLKIGFAVTAGQTDGSKIWIDDLSMTCNVPTTTEFLDWSITPEPFIQTSNTFSQYQGVTSTILCTIYDIGGLASENGSFVATSSLGQVLGSVTFGFFSFQLLPRTGTGNITETYSIQIFLPTRTVILQIRGTWLALDPGTDGETDPTQTETDRFINNLAMYIIALVVVLLPGVVLVALHLGGFGFFAGLNVGVILAYLTLPAYVPIWGVVIIVLVDVLLLFGKVTFPGHKGD